MEDDPWKALDVELCRWDDADRIAPFWWRDDDAIEPSVALNRLIETADGIPITLAAIPADTTAALFDRLAECSGISVAPHGWAHTNHAPPEAKKAEFGKGRPVDTALREIGEGWKLLSSLARQTGFDFLDSLFVPPWNRISPEVADRLSEVGLARLSVFGPRAPEQRERRLNTHADPVAWRDNERFLGDAAALAPILTHLRSCRLKDNPSIDPNEPTGLLTHHLRHDEATWNFVARLAETIATHPAAHWVSSRPEGGAP